jgi:ribosomal protein S18 acetylase RimI-like enzyme
VWGMGIGSAVMEKLIGYAEDHGTEIIELEVRSDNSRARHLYEKFGFRYIGTFPAFFKIGDEYIDFKLMYLDLRNR